MEYVDSGEKVKFVEIFSCGRVLSKSVRLCVCPVTGPKTYREKSYGSVTRPLTTASIIVS